MKRFGAEDEKAIIEVLRSENLSPYFKNPKGGAYVQQLEKEFAELVGKKYAVAVSNGTAALHLAYLAYTKPGQKIIVPAHSFIATASMVLAANCIPVFCDVNYASYNMDSGALGQLMETTENVGAIAPVDLLGNPCAAESIAEIAHSHHVPVIQDACQAVGAYYAGQHVGIFADCACWSGQFTKTFTIGGEGGLITTNDRGVYEKVLSMRSHGSHYLESPYLTFNFRLSELHAATGVIQLRKLPYLIQDQKATGVQLLNSLPPLFVPQLSLMTARPNFYIVGTTVETEFDRERFVKLLESKGVSKGEPGSVVGLGYQAPLYKKLLLAQYAPETPCPNAEELCDKWVWWDFRWKTPAEMQEIVRLVKEAINET